MKRFAQLTTSDRGAPCVEFPGEWLIGIPRHLQGSWTIGCFFAGNPGYSFKSFEEALITARRFLTYLEDRRVSYNPGEITISWKCSDKDPRIGESWFTPFYIHGKFNIFGEYKET